MTRTTLAIAATVSLLAPIAAGQPAPGARPNIIYIMSDDHAAHAIGAYGSRVNATPNLDRLAHEGALLTSVFATNSICTPSRAAILTGQKWHLGSDPVGFDHWEILPGQGVYFNPIFYTAASEKTYEGRYVTDVITDLA